MNSIREYANLRVIKIPRPMLSRIVGYEPTVTYFKPAGVPRSQLEEVKLSVEELEAIRLKDSEDFDQQEASEKMNVSQPTFHRLLFSARNKISDALVNGKSIRIEGGCFEYSPGRIRGPCWKGRTGYGRKRGFGRGPQ